MREYQNPAFRQYSRDVRLEQTLNWLESEIRRLKGNWIPKLGLGLAEANYQTFRERRHQDWQHEAWRLIHITAGELDKLEGGKT